jgi:hypothetical protein
MNLGKDSVTPKVFKQQHNSKHITSYNVSKFVSYKSKKIQRMKLDLANYPPKPVFFGHNSF